jgi:hypothetical protein
MAGSCLVDSQDLTALSQVIPAKYLPDKMRLIQNPSHLIDDFVGDLMGLLAASDVQIRDIVRDALGSELSPRLYGKLIRFLEECVLSSALY